jgi:hypothetical protein
VSSSRRRSRQWLALTASLAAYCAGPGGARADDTQPPVPQQSIFTSVRQAVKEDFDHEVIRGHFDVGTPPDVRRYYCLVDEKKGRRQPNGVSGQPAPRHDAMTGIKANAVSAYGCDSAEQLGLLVTEGYVLPAGSATAAAAAAAPKAVAPPPAASAAAPQPSPPAAAPVADAASGKLDVGGVRLGMSPDEVRAVLRSKKLRDYYESAQSLAHESNGGRFVNVIAAWTPPASPAGGGATGAQDSESYEVMFTPVPGRERAIAITHAVAYGTGGVLRETTLQAALKKKYGGFASTAELPASPTWRILSGGNVEVGDPCNRRGVIGSAGPFNVTAPVRPNLVLRTTLDEFQYQIDQCGTAVLTEDHVTSNETAARDERTVARFTVTAYSPALGLEGAKAAAQLMSAPETKGATRKDVPPAL